MITTDGFAQRDDRRVHWAATGQGPAIVLLPGIGGGIRLFGTLPRRFARHGMRALTYDPVGVAPSSALSGRFRFEDSADDVWAVVDDIARSTRPDDGRRALMLAQARALMEFDGLSFARAVRAPTLCVAGLEDTLTDAADVRATAKTLRYGTYAESPRADHTLLLEDASAFERVMAFLGASG